MAEISKITLPSGSTYDIKDAVAREAIASVFSYQLAKDAGTTPKNIVWKNASGTTITGTLVASASTKGTFYLVPSTSSKEGDSDIYDEYITVDDGASTPTYSWEKLGNTQLDIGDLGALAYKDSASVSYTPQGSVSQPTFSGSATTSTGKFTPSGSVTIGTGTGTANYTPSGSLSGGAISVTPSTVTKYVASSASAGGSVTAGKAASCTLPTLSTSVSNETLTLSWSAGSFTANTPTAVTMPSFSSQTIATGISSASISTQPSFTGTGVRLTGSFSGSEGDVSVSGTPSGTVSKPTFTGTAKTITVS